MWLKYIVLDFILPKNGTPFGFLFFPETFIDGMLLPFIFSSKHFLYRFERPTQHVTSQVKSILFFYSKGFTGHIFMTPPNPPKGQEKTP